METTVLVRSSSRDEPYRIVVMLDENGLSFYCDCQAGERGQLCKHKMALASGDSSILYNEEQSNNYNDVKSLVNKSNYPQLISELREYEKELEKVQKKIKGMKQKIARVMKEGLK